MAAAIVQFAGRRECGQESGCNLVSCLIFAVVVTAAVLLLRVSRVHAEHDNQTFTFDFSGSTQSWDADMQEFIIHNDGVLYVKLKSFVPASSTTYKPRIGFMKMGQAACPARYDSFVDDPALGTSYGPFYMEAETYVSYFFLNPGVDSYLLEIDYRRQLIANDVEPNDTSDTAEDIGNLPSVAHITGHIGYLGCVHDKKDYRRFGVTTSGSYLFALQFDSPFREKAECKMYFHLLDETASKWVLSYTGPQNTSALGPKYLEAGHTYLLSMETSGCYNTIYEGGGSFVVDNKAGAYDVTLTAQAAPPTNPFAITDLTVKPSLLWPGESLNGKVFLQNYKADPSGKIELRLGVVRLSDNKEAGAKEYTLFLAADELRIFEFSLGELLAPKKAIDLAGGKYKIVALARTRDAAGNITISSAREVGFEVNKHDKTISPIINFIMLNKKGGT